MNIPILVVGVPLVFIASPSEYEAARERLINDGVPPGNIELSLSGVIAWGRNAISGYASEIRAKLASNVDAYTLAGWADKSQRAYRVISGTNTDADIAILTEEAEARQKGETPQDLAAKQAAKAAALANAAAIIDGLESSALSVIDAATTPGDVIKSLSALRNKAESALENLKN